MSASVQLPRAHTEMGAAPLPYLKAHHSCSNRKVQIEDTLRAYKPASPVYAVVNNRPFLKVEGKDQQPRLSVVLHTDVWCMLTHTHTYKHRYTHKHTGDEKKRPGGILTSARNTSVLHDTFLGMSGEGKLDGRGGWAGKLLASRVTPSPHAQY